MGCSACTIHPAPTAAIVFPESCCRKQLCQVRSHLPRYRRAKILGEPLSTAVKTRYALPPNNCGSVSSNAIKDSGGVWSAGSAYPPKDSGPMPSASGCIVVGSFPPTPSLRNTSMSWNEIVAVPAPFALNRIEKRIPLSPENPPGVIPANVIGASALVTEGRVIHIPTMELPSLIATGSNVADEYRRLPEKALVEIALSRRTSTRTRSPTPIFAGVA